MTQLAGLNRLSTEHGRPHAGDHPFSAKSARRPQRPLWPALCCIAGGHLGIKPNPSQSNPPPERRATHLERRTYLIGIGLAPYALPTLAGASGIARLDHEALDVPVPETAVIVVGRTQR